MEFVEPNSKRWLLLEDLPNERWVDIENYECFYMISDYGRIKSLERKIDSSHVYKTRILKQAYDKDGYLNCTLSKNGISKTIRVHQMVGKYFVSNPDNLPIFDHIKEVDVGYCNNHYSNLQPITYSQNTKKAYKAGRKPICANMTGIIGKNNPCSIPVQQYDKDLQLIKNWDSIADIERALGYLHGNIISCCKGRYKTAYGYIWKYKKEITNGMDI